ncbi:MAG: D-cysteine desulfhydrase [Pseudomonadales bacterium]
MEFPAKLDLAQTPTPLQPLDRLSALVGGPRIWIKRDDLTGAIEGGNKIRKLEYILAKVISEGYDTVITCGGIQSNHCRATAALTARLGLSCHLILRGDQPPQADSNNLLDQILGATIDYYSAKQYFSELAQLFDATVEDYKLAGKRAYCIPTGASDGVGLWGYIEASRELKDDFAQNCINPEHIICATGSGGTQAGLTLGVELFDLNAKVWAVNVCDDEQYFHNKVIDDITDWKQLYNNDLSIDSIIPRTLDGYVGAGYGLAGDEVLDLINQLARLEGIVLDPVYTGKAFYGMLEELKHGRFSGSKDIVFIHTGGALGLFPFKERLQASASSSVN